MDSDNSHNNADTTPDQDRHSSHSTSCRGGVTVPDSSGDGIRSPLEVVVSEMSQLRIADEHPLSSALEQASVRNTLHELLRAAFRAGGLDAVDSTIDEINGGLRNKASRIELGAGAALAHDADGHPETLIVTLCKAGIDRPLVIEHIDLR
jgi:hypothetical protein